MNTIFVNLGKTGVVLGCTIMQLIAVILKSISLIFECIGLMFRIASGFLMNLSTSLLSKCGIVANNREELKETDT